MSDPKVKPSIAARELSREIADLLAVPATDANALGLPNMLQTALSDLLEKSGKVLFLAHEHVSPMLAKELRMELHKWRGTVEKKGMTNAKTKS